MADKPKQRRIRAELRRYFVTGILVLLPLAVTVWILWQIVGTVEGGVQALIERLNAALSPDGEPVREILKYRPGYGFLVVIAVVFGAGLIATNVFGRRLLRFFEGFVTRIPFVNKVYLTVQQIRDAFTGREHTLFQSVAVIEYPRPGLYTLCFVTSTAGGEVQHKTKERVTSVFVPTTPNPTSGYLLLVPDDQLTPLSMTVEEAMKMVISGGALIPPYKVEEHRSAEPAAGPEQNTSTDPAQPG
jgi:uncharacterized membrane protein